MNIKMKSISGDLLIDLITLSLRIFLVDIELYFKLISNLIRHSFGLVLARLS